MTDVLEIGASPTASEYTDLFVLQLYPYASVYLGAEGMMGGEARDRIAGFWRALGETPPAEPDHLAVMVAQYASLADGEASEQDAVRRRAIGHARVTFLEEHLLSWLPVYLDKVSRDGPPTYRAWAAMLRDVLITQVRRVEQPSALPLHLREAAPLPHPAAVDRDTFLSSVLAPIRSGMILTRQDLARAARETDLALRAGERRYALNALLDQDAPATWSWLEAEAGRWVERHGDQSSWRSDIAAFWSERAKAAQRMFAAASRHGDPNLRSVAREA